MPLVIIHVILNENVLMFVIFLSFFQFLIYFLVQESLLVNCVSFFPEITFLLTTLLLLN